MIEARSKSYVTLLTFSLILTMPAIGVLGIYFPRRVYLSTLILNSLYISSALLDMWQANEMYPHLGYAIIHVVGWLIVMPMGILVGETLKLHRRFSLLTLTANFLLLSIFVWLNVRFEG